MTREDEIFKQCCQMESDVPDRRVGFIEGAKWADKTMIEKVSKWLKEEFYTITNRNGYEDLVSASCNNVNELIEELKKVMEE